jgi:hypothetical protein
MDRIIETLKTEMAKYAVPGFNLVSHMMEDSAQQLYTVVTTVIEPNERYSFTSLYVRVVGDKIVIEHDANSDPLYEALLQAGIPREQIIVAYAGEPVPDVVESNG